MTKVKKNILFLSILLLISILTAVIKYNSWQAKHILTVGIYTGSPWDVPNNNQYRVFDYAIKEFKKNIPMYKLNMKMVFKNLIIVTG